MKSIKQLRDTENHLYQLVEDSPWFISKKKELWAVFKFENKPKELIKDEWWIYFLLL
jgi:hypothetical protein